MDNILNDGDFDNFLDLPNEFPDDILLDDIDSLDFINDLEGNLIYDCDLDQLKPTFVDNRYRCIDDDEIAAANTNIYYRNDGGNVCDNSLSNKESSGAHGNAMIRELLASNDNGPTRVCAPQQSYKSAVGGNRHIDSNALKHQIASNGLLNYRVSCDPQRIIGSSTKHPVILPATSIANSNGHLTRTPTLAATLIGIQVGSHASELMDGDSCSYGSGGGGKVVRRNSHNAIEKRYRLSINDRIDELRQMLSLGDNSKMNKSAVLRKAVEHIRLLEQENSSLKCENYNFRKSLTNGGGGSSSNESLHKGTQSPLSNQSDSGHSITNSPSSSSMNSNSVSSSFLFYKNNENQSRVVNSNNSNSNITNPNNPNNNNNNNNNNKGVKRPLIYDNTNIATVKTEKLARLLLSTSDSFEDKSVVVAGHLKEIHNDHNLNRRLHSSNVPNFLLCTMALFVVAFQPFDYALSNYRSGTATISAGGRQILQSPDSFESPLSEPSLVLTVILFLGHWALAFLLVWGSTNNRYILTKVASRLLEKAQAATFISFNFKECSVSVDSVERTVSSWREEPIEIYDSKLDGYLRLYGCSCPTNLFSFSLRLLAVLFWIVVSFIPLRIGRGDRERVALKVALHLVTCSVERGLSGCNVPQLKSLWYRALLVLLIRNDVPDARTAISKVIITQLIPFDIIRKYVVKRQLDSILSQNSVNDSSMPDKYRCLFDCAEMRKSMIKSSFKKIQERCRGGHLMVPMRGEMAHCYYVAFVNDVIVSAVKKILERSADAVAVVESLRWVMSTSATVITSEETALYINNLCAFLIVSVDDDSDKKQRDLMELAARLRDYYSRMTMVSAGMSDESLQQAISVLRLFLSTMRFSADGDSQAHEVNLTLISSITKKTITNIVSRMIFDLSLDAIVRSLTSHRISLSQHNSNIFYADMYNSVLRDCVDEYQNDDCHLVSKFETLFQNLCQVNPIKCGMSNTESKEPRKAVSHYRYRVTEFLWSERGRHSGSSNGSMQRCH